MGKYDDDFFGGKRPWSVIKDRVLRDYMNVYLAKVNTRGQHIVLIDAYAGPGVFQDGSNGSPIIICTAAEKFAKNNYSAFFFNIRQDFHSQLETALKNSGFNSAHAFKTNSLKTINQLPQILKDNTVFLYLDPFGLKGCGYDQLEPFLKRNSKYSTEIVLTMCMPAVHRMAAFHAVKRGEINEKTKKYHERLTTVFGGDYWKDILYQENVDAETKEFQLIDAYLSKSAQFLPFTGYCPVRQKSDSRIKYFMVFVSGHPDAMVLMNDIMHKAYFSQMHRADFQGTLFEELDWRDMPLTDDRSEQKLNALIKELVSKYPGETRENIWLQVVKSNFMKYERKFYRSLLKNMADKSQIVYQVDPSTGRRNENSKLYPV
ncbi:three-Cys-motif partner protein TcmP [Dictyobacter arantiisoli]|uniref:Three-Cys-motif partner protein TcmP n=1 Tax=Dictyobacter arantiisoli TaxID=2014874 RepID=A0A5A5TKW5_9CHLR|nr:three-Cys-motif partner protein TcmP [Dictyobacter arantiisoli]GCF11945.1 hypothetical protein KDI_55090 [Dictyobacter arantiisoli]